MILITGQSEKENLEFAQNFGFKKEEMFFVAEFLQENFTVENFESLKCEACKIATQKKIVICKELGCAVSPLGFEKRRFQELNGETAREIAVIAREVYLVENHAGEKIK